MKARQTSVSSNPSRINEILRAEREAEDAVVRAGREAEAVIAAGRADAGRIANRADGRVREVQRITARAAEVGRAALLSAAAADARVQDDAVDEQEHIRAAAARVVDWLLGLDEVPVEPLPIERSSGRTSAKAKTKEP